MKLLAKTLFCMLFATVFLPTTLLLWLNFSPDPVAQKSVTSINAHFDTIAKNHKKATPLDHVLFKGLYFGMYSGGKVFFPEAASNLRILFSNDSQQDQMQHSSYLFWSPTIRSSIYNATYKKDLTGSVQCTYHSNKQKRCAIIAPESVSALATIDLRNFFLYNPWQLRIEEGTFFRTVSIYQWMKFVDAQTPFLPGSPNPINIQDDLLELDGKSKSYTSYNIWMEPKLPTEVYMYLSYAFHALHWIIASLSCMFALPMLYWTIKNKDEYVSRWLYRIGYVGMAFVCLRLFWDLCIDLTAVPMLWGEDSGGWVSYLREDPKAVRPNNVLTQGLGGYCGNIALKITSNVFSLYICAKVCAMAKGILHNPYVKLLVIVALIFPVFGLPFPLSLTVIPSGFVLLWRYDPNREQIEMKTKTAIH